MSLQNFDPKGIVGSVTSYRKHVGDVLVPAHGNSAKIGVPVAAKVLATKYLSSKHPRAVVEEIYEAGLSIESGVVIRLREPGQFNEYVSLMYEADQFNTLRKLRQSGDGIALT